LGRFHTTAGIELSAPINGESSAAQPPIVHRAAAARESEGEGAGLGNAPIVTRMRVDSAVRPAQIAREEIAPPAAAPTRQSTPFVDIHGRNGRPLQNSQFFNVPERGEGMYVINSGVQIIVQGFDQLGTVSLDADRAVVWTPVVNITD